jgi:hypothetical protein
MSELLTKGINRDVQLSINVQSFEDDFSNGYYLGELLLRLKMIPIREFETHFRVSGSMYVCMCVCICVCIRERRRESSRGEGESGYENNLYKYNDTHP